MRFILLFAILLFLSITPLRAQVHTAGATLAIGNRPPETRTMLGCWDNIQSDKKFGPIRITPSLTLTTNCGTLYMRNQKGSVMWTLRTSAPLTDAPKIVNGEVVVIGYDLNLFGINMQTGVPLWRVSNNSGFLYSQLERYKNDRFFVMVDMSHYDDRFQLCAINHPKGWNACPRGTNDALWLFRRDEQLQEWSVPARSKVEVLGDSVFVSWHNNRKRFRRRIALSEF